MEKWKDIKIDDETMWPDNGKVNLIPAHKDDRGYIQTLVNFPMKNVALIRSKKISVRSNHYHMTDWHYMYTLKGSYDYYYRPTGSNEELKVIHMKQGEMVFTPPMEDHATVFLEETDLLVMSRNPRDQASYESDVKRVVLIDPVTLKQNV